jgi:hypothetical protein
LPAPAAPKPVTPPTTPDAGGQPLG